MTWPQDPECLDGTPKRITTNKGNTFEADIVVSFPVLQAWPSHPPLHRPDTSSSPVQARKHTRHCYPPFPLLLSPLPQPVFTFPRHFRFRPNPQPPRYPISFPTSISPAAVPERRHIQLLPPRPHRRLRQTMYQPASSALPSVVIGKIPLAGRWICPTFSRLAIVQRRARYRLVIRRIIWAKWLLEIS
jgi:hypothetical protein